MYSTQSVGYPTLAYDYVSRRVLMASMRALDPSPGVIGGAVLDAQGTPLTSTFILSTAPATVSGTYYPTVRTGAGGVLALSYINDYQVGPVRALPVPGGVHARARLLLLEQLHGATATATAASPAAVTLQPERRLQW